MAVIFGVLAGKKTYMAASCLAMLGVVELCLGNVPMGLQTLLMALSTAGLRGAIAQSQVA